MAEKWANGGGISNVDPQSDQLHGHTSDPAGAKFLERLPDEIWEMVVEKLEDSKDIQNFFKAFPQMEGLIMKNTYVWLFDQVIPHIFLLLSKTDMLNCRRVRKSWNFGVTNFVENHLARRAYSRDIQPTGQRWIPEATQLYSDVDTHFFNMWPSISIDGWIPRDIIRVMHPPNRNPFIAKSIKITKGDTYRRWRSFWGKVQPGLQYFGHHIWFLSIHFHTMSNPSDLPQILEQILSFVPNLKRLKIKINSTRFYAQRDFLVFLETELPALHQLESLEVDWPPLLRPIYNILMTSYSQQIRKLKSVHALVRTGSLDFFPELTELFLTKYASTATVAQILAQLEAPNLSRLVFGLVDHNSFEIESRIVPLLSGFPHLRSLAISLFLSLVPSEGQSGGLAHLIRPIPSLKSFCLDGVQDKYMDLDFLQFFPALEYIKIHYGDGNVPVCFNEQNIYEPRIWKLLPHLRGIVLEEIGTENKGHYTRARYDARQPCLDVLIPWKPEMELDEDGQFKGFMKKLEWSTESPF